MTAVAHPSAATTRRHGFFPTLRHGATLTWRSLLKLKHSPEQLLDLTVGPIMFVVLFVFLFGGAVSGGWREYLQYVLPGILVQTVVFASLGTGVGINTDLKTGIFNRFRALPIARSAPLIGIVTGDVIRYIVSVFIVLAFGMILGFKVQTDPMSVIAASALALGFAFALCWIAAILGMIVKTAQSVQMFGFTVMFPLTFASDAFVDPDTLPGWLQAWVNVNPITALNSSVRGLLIGGPVSTPVLHTLAWSIGIFVVFFPLAVWVYRKKLS